MPVYLHIRQLVSLIIDDSFVIDKSAKLNLKSSTYILEDILKYSGYLSFSALLTQL